MSMLSRIIAYHDLDDTFAAVQMHLPKPILAGAKRVMAVDFDLVKCLAPQIPGHGRFALLFRRRPANLPRRLTLDAPHGYSAQLTRPETPGQTYSTMTAQDDRRTPSCHVGKYCAPASSPADGSPTVPW